MIRRHGKAIIIVLLAIITALIITGILGYHAMPVTEVAISSSGWTLKELPEYSGDPYVRINDNKPSFPEEEMTNKPFEHYSDLDALGRCGTAYANIGPETMPKEEREPIGSVHPSGWQVANYHGLIDGNYLYNRCHLIAFSLAGENANEKNLITGTRYLNTEGMQPFELMILDYVRDAGSHVLYRVTPVFEGDNLVATGVEMEAMSVGDHGKGISFHIFAYNVQPGVIIDYKTGDNRPDPNYQKPEDKKTEEKSSEEESTETEGKSSEQKTDQTHVSTDTQEELSEEHLSEETEGTYILNTNTHRFHYPSCDNVNDMKDKNKETSTESREKLIEEGYLPCGRCKP